MNTKFKLSFIFSTIIFMVSCMMSCEKLIPVSPEEETFLDGTTEGLTYEQTAQFLRGDAAVNEVFTATTGLGPIFVSNSCISCHAGDGKGHPATILIRFGQNNETGNNYMHLGGPQLQNKSIAGFLPEQLPMGVSSSKFIAPAFTGLGFLQYVTDEDIIKLTDPNDANNDEISGVASWLELPSSIKPNSNAITKNGKYLHRFGKKASAYDLLHQTVNAYNQDMGITSDFAPIDVYSQLETDAEISTQKLNDVVAYLTTLKTPIQRNQNDADVLKGKAIFSQINCSGCHTPVLKTGNSSIKAIANKEFYPYTDMLLHDMGKDLDDGYTEGTAKTSEWKTPALWGLGLSKDSQGGKVHLLHDGRAKSIDEAITLHGGEAQKSRAKYAALNSTEKQQLLKFLESL